MQAAVSEAMPMEVRRYSDAPFVEVVQDIAPVQFRLGLRHHRDCEKRDRVKRLFTESEGLVMSRLPPIVPAVLISCWAATAAFAQPIHTDPRYYRVTGVAADDVLNIRSAPTASAEIVGKFEPGAQPVEVLDTDKGWARVIIGEGMGWASADYLEPIQMSPIGDSTLPAGLLCAGTEPFWSLHIDRESVTYSAAGAEDRVMSVVKADGFAGAGPGTNFVIASGEGSSITAVVSNQRCSDGMSDRDYPRRIDVVLSGADGVTGLTGCCRVPVN
ncbi:SH3 domain-containing protein [Microbulbifer rhizosphaerae]